MFLLIAALASSLQLASAEPALTAAPIPIDGPITISQSGDYIVTRDFAAEGVPAIQYSHNATATVTIDFDGHRVDGRIDLRLTDLEQGLRRLTIRNGEYHGDIAAQKGTPQGWSELTLDSMIITSDLYLEDAKLVAKHCRFVNSSLSARADRSVPLMHVEDSEVIGGSINGQGSRWYFVGNDIQNASIVLASGMLGFTTGLVAGNVVRNGSIVAASNIVAASGLQILGNDLSGSISLNPAIGSLVYGNVIRCGGGGTAIRVDGLPARNNEIVHNEFLGGCDHGIYFGDGTWDNVYGDNHFQFPVPQPIVDFGENNRRLPTVNIAPE